MSSLNAVHVAPKARRADIGSRAAVWYRMSGFERTSSRERFMASSGCDLVDIEEDIILEGYAEFIAMFLKMCYIAG